MRNGALRPGDLIRVKEPTRWEGKPAGEYVVSEVFNKPGFKKDWIRVALPGVGGRRLVTVGTFAASDLVRA